ncbi:MAG: filamentous hemagglutinin N-terminal domain-containing protein [Alphaproteobacteria bacterium]|nr:filamentous hemagglutinin N-terminal domain-containing protein [Alphaproteobacteria bacterium]
MRTNELQFNPLVLTATRPQATYKRRVFLASTTAAALWMIAVAGGSEAAPLFGQLDSGYAKVTSDNKTTTITQSSSRAVLKWQSFDLAAEETVNFVVPDSNASTLNLVGGTTASTIAGTINSNGTVYFVNPNGMVFNATSRVNTIGFIASTAFLGRPYECSGCNLEVNKTGGTIVLDGKITSDYVRIVGPQVSMAGEITTNHGNVDITSSYRNMSLGKITTNGGDLRLNGGGNIALNGAVNLGSGSLGITLVIPSSKDMSTADTGNGTITNRSDLVAEKLWLTSNGSGKVTLDKVQIAKLGRVSIFGRNQQETSQFTLTNLRDLTLTDSVSLNSGGVSLTTVGGRENGISFAKGTYLRISSRLPGMKSSEFVPASLTLNSAGDITIHDYVSVMGDASFTAVGNIRFYKQLYVASSLPKYNSFSQGNLSITSTSGSIYAAMTIGGMLSLTITAAKSIELNNLMSNGAVSITRSCEASGCVSSAADITLNGQMRRYTSFDAPGTTTSQSLAIVNNIGNILINRSVEVDRSIAITAKNGSVFQASSETDETVILSRNGKVRIRSLSSPYAVGIRVHHVESEAQQQNTSGKAIISNPEGGILLQADGDIVVIPRPGHRPSLSTSVGSVQLISVKGTVQK